MDKDRSDTEEGSRTLIAVEVVNSMELCDVAREIVKPAKLRYVACSWYALLS